MKRVANESLDGVMTIQDPQHLRRIRLCPLYRVSCLGKKHYNCKQDGDYHSKFGLKIQKRFQIQRICTRSNTESYQGAWNFRHIRYYIFYFYPGIEWIWYRSKVHFFYLDLPAQFVQALINQLSDIKSDLSDSKIQEAIQRQILLLQVVSNTFQTSFLDVERNTFNILYTQSTQVSWYLH